MVHDFGHSFETTRINQLFEERLDVQKKTFTKWINSYLLRHRLEVTDLFVDLCDGKKLLKLLEIISNQKIGKPNHGRMRVHKIENVNKCLNFLHTHIKIESIGAEDIVDGNKKLILGLIWTIILRFQIQDIQVQDDANDNSPNGAAKHSAKDALLLWCQRKTKGYRGVKIIDFTNSWRDGLAFNALIHSQRPELVDFEKLEPQNAESNLRNAFEIARKNLAIEPLLDVEDITETVRPDERSVLTYVSSYYHSFAKFQKEVVSGKRITNTISQLMEINRCQLNYEMYTTNLLNWIQMKCLELDKRDLPNSLEEVQKEMSRLKEYLSVEKPPKYRERSEIEALYFQISTKMKVMRHKVPYKAPEGKLIKDIHKAWTALEKAEHQKEVAIRNEIIRLENLQNLSNKFDKRSKIRMSYINDMIRVLTTPYASAMTQVDATVKKHEAIRLDVLSKDHKIDELSAMIATLQEGNYHKIEHHIKVHSEIREQWEKMWALLKLHQNNLAIASALMTNIREMNTVESELRDLIDHISSEGTNVPHLRAAEEFMQNHALQEVQILSQGDVVRRLTSTASKLLQDENVLSSSNLEKEVPTLRESQESLTKTYAELQTKAKAKHEKLIKNKEVFQMLQDVEEEESAIVEKKNICQAILPGKDLFAIIGLQQKHNALEADVHGHETRLKQIELKCHNIEDASEIGEKLQKTKENLQSVKQIISQKSKELNDATEAFQYHADANEAQSWLNEKMQIAKSEDYGMDEQSALSLLQRHSRLEDEVNVYEHDIERLNKQSDKMISSGVDNLFFLASDDPLLAAPITEDVFEVIEKEVIKEVYEEILVPRVEVLYNFARDGYSVQKGEVLILYDKTTSEWWNVKRKGEPNKGFVPANYVREIEPELERVLVQTPIKIKEKIKKKPMSNNRFANRAAKRGKRRLSIVSDFETVADRKDRINQEYQTLLSLCAARKSVLEDTVKWYQFENECKALEQWMDQCGKNLLQVAQSNSDSLIKQYEAFITETITNRPRLDAVNKLASQIEPQSPYFSQTQQRQKEVNRKWMDLQLLQKKFGKDIEGLTTIEMFNSKCDDAIERICDKQARVDITTSFPDLKTVQDFKRKHENIKRELLPVEEELRRLQILSENLKSSRPELSEKVDQRLSDLTKHWEHLTRSSLEKRNELDRLMGLQILRNSSTELLSWLHSYVRPALKFDVENSDFKTDLVNIDTAYLEHQDLANQIRSKNDEIAQLSSLATQLAEQVPPEELVIVQELIEEYNQTWTECAKKENFIEQCKDLVLFKHECDRLEAVATHNLADLNVDNFDGGIEDVIAMRKRHKTFIATLMANEPRVHKLLDDGKKLLQKQHFDSDAIAERIQSIQQLRKQVMDRAFEVEKLLKSAHIYHEIKADADELLNWCENKSELVDNNELRETSNMPRKYKKHQRFEAEVRAHRGQLDKIERIVKELVSNESPNSEELKTIRENSRNAWNKLIALIDAKGKLFNQAFGQIEFSKNLVSIKQRVSEIESLVGSDDFGRDRRSCKQHTKSHRTAVNDLNILEDRLKALELKSNEIAEDHLNREDILSEYAHLMQQIQALKEPLTTREVKLNQANRYFQLKSDIDGERQWIKDYEMRLNHFKSAGNVSESQEVLKKFEKNFLNMLSSHHDVSVKPLLENCQKFTQNEEFAEKDELASQMDQLKEEWSQLCGHIDARHAELQRIDKKFQFIEECATIESWIFEKSSQLSSGTFSSDEQMMVKMLQKQKQNDLEIDIYKGLIDELAQRNAPQDDTVDAAVDVDVKPKQDPVFQERITFLRDSMKKVVSANSQRTQDLIEIKRCYEFENEFSEHMQFMEAHISLLLNEGFGKDYEHCMILQAKFIKHKSVVLDNEERIRLFVQFGENIIKNLNDNNKKFEITQIQDRITALEEKFAELMEQIKLREENFHGAIVIHRFNRDIADTYERFLEKLKVLENADLGRDTYSVEALIRKHDMFQNDLVALEAQLQVLINDSVDLKVKYPGDNARQIEEKLQQTYAVYYQLKDRTEKRTVELSESERFFKFLSRVRDWNDWAQSIIDEMSTFETVSDTQSSQALKGNHQRLWSEISVREKDLEQNHQLSSTFTGTRYQDKVIEVTTEFLKTRDLLENAWRKKNVYLDQLCDFNCFKNDVKNFERTMQQNLNILNNSIVVEESLEEVNRLLKKHNEFARLFETTEAKYRKIEGCAQQLKAKMHPNSDQIQLEIEALVQRRQQILQMIQERSEELNDAQIFATFKLDVSDADSWIEEKRGQIENQKVIAAESNVADSLETKIIKLQRHQVLEGEINANSLRIEQIRNKAAHLIQKNHTSAIQVRSQQDELLGKWAHLRAIIADALQGYEEERDYYEFCQNVDQISSWIRAKEVMLQLGDVGKDLEHCEALLRKLDDVDSDMKVDEDKMVKINKLTNGLIQKQENGSNVTDKLFNVEQVAAKRSSLTENWQELQRNISVYRNKLLSAQVIHSLNRDLDDLCERAAEKEKLIGQKQEPSSLSEVEAFKRKLDEIAVDICAIDNSFSKINETQIDISSQLFPEITEVFKSKLLNTQNGLRKLQTCWKNREVELANAHLIHKFYDAVRQLELWGDKLSKSEKLTDQGLGFVSTSEAKEHLAAHEDIKAEIVSKRENFATLKEYGSNLVIQFQRDCGDGNAQSEQTSELVEQINTRLNKLEDLRKQLNTVWDERHKHLKECLDLQLFSDLFKLCDSWLSRKEALLTNDDFGGSLAEVETLIKRHETFVNSLSAEQRLSELVEMGNNLRERNHFDAENIAEQTSQITKRRERLFELSKQRNTRLIESKAYYLFLRNHIEIMRWIDKKVAVAVDDNYRDLMNLLSKKQRHAAFEAEIVAFKVRIDALVSEGESLVSADNLRATDVKKCLEELDERQKQLQHATTLKKLRLHEASEVLQYSRSCDELAFWISNVENLLSNRDCGNNLTSIRVLIKKQERLECDVQAKAELFDSIKTQLEYFESSNYYMPEEIATNSNQIFSSYRAIQAPLVKRREILEEFLVFFQFKHDIQHEIMWLSGKENQLNGFDQSNITLLEVQRLIKRMKAFDTEIIAKESILIALVSKGHSLIKQGGYNIEKINSLTHDLSSKFQNIKDQFVVLNKRLLDSLASQEFLSEVSEANSWIEERMSLLISPGSEKMVQDEESLLTIEKKLDLLKLEAERFQASSLARLNQLLTGFVEKNHFELETIQAQMEALNNKFTVFIEVIASQLISNSEQKKYYAFLRDADEFGQFIEHQMIVSRNEEYGNDVEHVEKLIQQFDSFVASLSANDEKLESFKNIGANIIGVESKIEQLEKLCRQLKDENLQRSAALLEAKKVHLFYQSADETSSWVRQKLASNVLEPVNIESDDLYSIQAKIHELESFSRELEAVQQQVEDLFTEASHLIENVPDIKQSIEEKISTVRVDWVKLLELRSQQSDNLNQIEKIRSYFDDYRDLVSWMRETMALITADSTLAVDVLSSEEQLNRYKEYRIEIDARFATISAFLERGRQILESGHFMSREVGERNVKIENDYQLILTTWESRALLFEHNIKARQYLLHAQSVEKWFAQQETFLRDPQLGDSIEEVEEIIAQFSEFENVIDNQHEKINAVKKITDLENYFKELMLQEELIAQRAAEHEKEMTRIKQKEEEQKRILLERKNEEHGIYENTKFLNKNRLQTASPSKNNMSKILRKSSFNILGRKQPSPIPSTSSLKTKPVEDQHIACAGFLERKHLEENGKKATMRSWKSFYTVLCGQLLCFFKDQAGFESNSAAAPPISIHGAKVSRDMKYAKKRNAFVLMLCKENTSCQWRYMFVARNGTEMADWMQKIDFRASLPPSMQLQSMNAFNEKSVDVSITSSSPVEFDHNPSICSSETSSRRSSIGSLQQRNVSTVQNGQPMPIYKNGHSLQSSTRSNGQHSNEHPDSSDLLFKENNPEYQNVSKYMSLPAMRPPQAVENGNRKVLDDSNLAAITSDKTDSHSLGNDIKGSKKSKSRLSFLRRKKK